MRYPGVRYDGSIGAVWLLVVVLSVSWPIRGGEPPERVVDSAQIDRKPTTQSPSNPGDFFPNTVGSVWRYAAGEYTGLGDLQFNDTAVYTLTQIITDSIGNKYAEKKLTWLELGWVPRYYYERRDNDTLSVFWGAIPPGGFGFIYNMFVLPFDSGRAWANTTFGGAVDSLWVVGFEDVTVPAGSFPSAVHIKRRFDELNGHLRADYWIIAGVGIVKTSEVSFRAPSIRDGAWTYELISCRIVEPYNCPCLRVGNVDCDPGNIVDVADLSALIDNLFISIAPSCCDTQADIDGVPGIDISDISALIDHLFISFRALRECS
ncbi:MAG: hypothetical protein HY851_03175 [candidate division Zixibacteria bacterium]|nr:hypothetical protein [candidate division Zixibacteria bacterium]